MAIMAASWDMSINHQFFHLRTIDETKHYPDSRPSGSIASPGSKVLYLTAPQYPEYALHFPNGPTTMRSRTSCALVLIALAKVNAFTTTPFVRINSMETVHPPRWHARKQNSRLPYLYDGETVRSRPATALSSFFDRPDGGNEEAAIDYLEMKPEVSPQRWVQLAYLSLLALLSDWVCFAVAAAPSTFETNFGHSAASIIDIFLFTNVATSFIVTDVVSTFGIQRAIQAAAVLMATGCWLRAGLGFLPGQSGLVDYPLLVIGTVFVGIAQPFFQCTPPLLSAMWFAKDERSTSTAIALNFNQIGIATAFLVGGSMATNAAGLEKYFGLIAVATSIVTIGTLLQFQDEPEIPPSMSELEKRILGEKEPPFLESVQKFFKTKGFTNALAAFICSISITNVVGAFIDDVMKRGGVSGQFEIDLAGAGFELAIVAGGILLGGLVDRTKKYKAVTMACLASTAFFVLPLGLTDHALGREPLLLIAALLGLGMAAGPIQPINAELAVDVTYPGDETAVESVQQIGGNLVSALLIPLAEMASEKDYTLLPGVPGLESDIRGDVVLLIALAMITLGYFSNFDAPLLRTLADGDEEEIEALNGIGKQVFELESVRD